MSNNHKTSPHLSPITEMVQAHKNREFSIDETVQSCCDQIDLVNAKYNAVIWRDNEFLENEIARATKQLENENVEHPLLGLPILVKELDSPIKGTLNSWGNRQLKEAGYKDSITATSIELLQNAGAVIVGKTNNSELGLTVTTNSSAHGPCNNPLDVRRNTGGSSGGSTAATASGMVSVATASDGGGSARIPAAACGVFGLKPSRDLITLGPSIDEAWAGLVCKGLISSNISDMATVLDTLTQNHFDFSSSCESDLPKLRIGVRVTGFGSMYSMNPSVVKATEKVADYLSNLGHHVSLSSPKSYDDIEFNQHFLDIIAYNTFADMNYLRTLSKCNINIEECDPVTQYFYSQGANVGSNQYSNARQAAKSFSLVTENWFEDFDILLTPTSGDVAPLHGAVEKDPEIGPLVYGGLCFPSNVSGMPALSVPVNCDDETGLPSGVQIIASQGNDALVLQLGSFLNSDYSDIFVTQESHITS